MREVNEHQKEVRDRWLKTYLRQRLSLTDFLAIFICLPYVVILAAFVPVLIALGLVIAPVWFLMSGNWALIEGATDASARNDVRRGMTAAYVLLAMAPLALVGALFLPGIDEPALVAFGIVLAVVALLRYRYRTRQYNAKVGSAT
jgi:hypothetical protein